MLQASNLSKCYGENLIFEHVNLILNAGERVGLVGPNGCGKTTLLRILVGEEEPDEGSVSCAVPRTQIGYLPQALAYEPDARVQDVMVGSPELNEEALAAQVQRLAEQLATAQGAAWQALEREYAAAMSKLDEATRRLPRHLVERVLAGLGLADVPLDAPVRTLSGGQRTRLGLARILARNPALLLLDEPTNHLDIAALAWLEEYLCGYEGGMLVVSHDRAFLDRLVTRVWEIDPLRHALASYEGNYSDYARAKAREREKQWQAYKEQQERIAQSEGAVRQLKGQARKIEKETIHFHYRKIAKKVARQAVVRQRRIERLLASEERVDKPQLTWKMKLEFVETPPSGQDVLTLTDLAKRYGERTLFEGVNLTLRRGERIMLVGPNGSGKTTLLRIIAGEVPPSAGRAQLGANVRLGYFAQDQDNLDGALTPLESVRRVAALDETEARSFLHFFLFSGDDVFVPVGKLSFGERARLALGVLVLQGCNLLLLDEPINHLDIPSRDKFEQALSSYEGTILAVAHDRYFIERFATGVWAVERGAVRRYVDLAEALAAGAALGEGMGRNG